MQFPFRESSHFQGSDEWGEAGWDNALSSKVVCCIAIVYQTDCLVIGCAPIGGISKKDDVKLSSAYSSQKFSERRTEEWEKGELVNDAWVRLHPSSHARVFLLTALLLVPFYQRSYHRSSFINILDYMTVVEIFKLYEPGFIGEKILYFLPNGLQVIGNAGRWIEFIWLRRGWRGKEEGKPRRQEVPFSQRTSHNDLWIWRW